MAKILFIDSTHPILYQILKDQSFQLDFDFESNKEEIISKISSYHAIVIRSRMKIDKEIIDAATNLKCIARLGSGMENIDIPYAETKGISCVNSPEGNRDAVAEHALGMFLTLQNNIIKADAEVRNGLWLREENRGYEIAGKTVAIIGYGNMGSAFAQRLQGFDCNVIIYDKYKHNYAPRWAKEVQEQEVFETADIVSYHLPYNEETHFLVNKEYLTKFKKSITLINTSRGKIVKTADLVEALENKSVKAACLDVLESEKVNLQNLEKENWGEDMHKLAKMQNVVLTPHIAGWTHESNIKLAQFLAQKIISSLKD